MKQYQYYLLPIVLFLPACRDKVANNTGALPLQIIIESPASANNVTTETFLQKIAEYRFRFSGKFGERKYVIKRNGKPETVQLTDVPFDSNLYIETEVMGLAWDVSKGEWRNGEVLAKSEVSGPYNWEAGNREPLTINCLLTELGESTYEEIFNMYSHR